MALVPSNFRDAPRIWPAGCALLAYGLRHESQRLEMYRAQRQMGFPVEVVRYPREDHGPLSACWSGLQSADF